MSAIQSKLFDAHPGWPEGFRHQPGLLSEAEAQQIVDRLAELDFKPFEFRGYLARRQVVSFGWTYDFNHARMHEAEPIPEFLELVRARAAEFAGLRPERLAQVLINAYAAGAGIGWHRDRPQFGEVVGVSLGSPALLRFRRRRGAGWDRVSVPLESRSAYMLTGAARSEWEHSLPEVDALRYSVTFRTLRAMGGQTAAPDGGVQRASGEAS